MRTLTKEICKDYVEKLREGLDSNGISLNEEIYLLALEYTLLKWCEPGGLAERDINGWIKCSEQMPEETEVFNGDDFSPDVLVIDQFEDMFVACTHWGKWIRLKHHDCVISHWQPLPKLPTSVR